MAYIITVALIIKAFSHFIKDNFNQPFLTPFYSQLLRFAGTPASTFRRESGHRAAADVSVLHEPIEGEPPSRCCVWL
jgi:hypothetical protein